MELTMLFVIHVMNKLLRKEYTHETTMFQFASILLHTIQ